MIFLETNGYVWEGPDYTSFAHVIIDVIARAVDEGALRALFEHHVRPRDD